MLLERREKEQERARRRARLAQMAGEPWPTPAQLPARKGEPAEAAVHESTPLAILRYLFPYADVGPLEGVDAQQARDSGRIRSPDRFDGYFRLEPRADEVPRRDAVAVYDALVRIGNADSETESALADVARQIRAVTEPLRQSLFRQLDDRAVAMSLAEARALAGALPPFARDAADVALEAALAGRARASRPLSVSPGWGRGG